MLYHIALTTITAALGMPPVLQPQGEGQVLADAPEVDRLFRLLEVRDRALLPLRLGFEEWRVPTRSYAGDVDPAAAGGAIVSTGWAWWDGRATKSEFELVGGNTRVVIDATGIQACSLVLKTVAPKPTEWPAIRTIERAHGSFWDAGAPVNFGYGYLGATWPQVKRLSDGFVVRGRESILGRDCVRIGLRYGAAGGGPKHVPLDVWFDDKDSLLALRVEIYEPVHGVMPGQMYTAADLESLPMLRDGIRVVPGILWEVLRLDEKDGQTTPALGRLTSAGGLVQDVSRVIRMNRAELVMGAATPQLDTELPPGGLHVDTIKDLSYIAGSDGRPLTPVQQDYLKCLEKLGIDNPGAMPGFDFGSLSFTDGSCGDYAVQLLAHRFGVWCTVDSIHEASGVPRRGKDPMSLAELSSLMRGQGLAATPVSASLEQLAAWNEAFIAHTSRPEPGASESPADGHFLIARVGAGGKEVRYINPPGPERIATAAEFASIWTGNALLVARDESDFLKFSAEAPATGPGRVAGLSFLGLGTLVLLGLGMQGMLRRRVSHAA